MDVLFSHYTFSLGLRLGGAPYKYPPYMFQVDQGITFPLCTAPLLILNHIFKKV